MKTYVVGAGGFGKEVRSFMAPRFVFGGYIDDNIRVDDVVCEIDACNQLGAANIILAIGSSGVRRVIMERMVNGFIYPVILHPSVILQSPITTRFGKGTIICAGSIFTCNITLGKFCLVNLNCTIGHDVKMGDFCSLMPSVNISGGVTLEDEVFIGTGATVLPGITIGAGATVGAGAVVTKNVAPNAVVIGVPAIPV